MKKILAALSVCAVALAGCSSNVASQPGIDVGPVATPTPTQLRAGVYGVDLAEPGQGGQVPARLAIPGDCPADITAYVKAAGKTPTCVLADIDNRAGASLNGIREVNVMDSEGRKTTFTDASSVMSDLTPVGVSQGDRVDIQSEYLHSPGPGERKTMVLISLDGMPKVFSRVIAVSGMKNIEARPTTGDAPTVPAPSPSAQPSAAAQPKPTPTAAPPATAAAAPKPTAQGDVFARFVAAGGKCDGTPSMPAGFTRAETAQISAWCLSVSQRGPASANYQPPADPESRSSVCAPGRVKTSGEAQLCHAVDRGYAQNPWSRP